MVDNSAQALAHRRIPPRAGAATRVLLVADDPNSGAADLAQAIGADPALASKTLALANSAYYGLSGRVGTLPFAVSVLGFQTIRALAVATSAGLDGPNAIPPGFWEQAATAAVAANLVGPMVGATASDAFCVGLLHTVGSALLHQQQQPLPALCLPFPADQDEFDRREFEVYGVGHARAGAETLALWRLPAQLCTLIASHHDPIAPDALPLARALRVARVVTDLLLRADAGGDEHERVLLQLTDGQLAGERLERVLADVRDQAAALLDGLGYRSADPVA